jgi:N-acetylneuraminic acid mutarotase
MKLYWERKPSIKWSPDSREGATLVTMNNKMYLFGGLSKELHKDT